MRIIKSMEDKYLLPSLDLIEAVFTDYENPVDAKITRNLAAEIRAGRFYDPRLELIMVEDENDEVIGYCMFSRFHLEGKYEDRLHDGNGAGARRSGGDYRPGSLRRLRESALSKSWNDAVILGKSNRNGSVLL